MNLLGQQVKGQGHGDTKYRQKGTLKILKVTSSKVMVTDNLSGEGVPGDSLPSKIVCIIVSYITLTDLGNSCTTV